MTEAIACFVVDSVTDAWGNPGAMAWAHHQHRPHDVVRRPMPHLMVCTPAGLVCIDCPESDSPAMWERAGEPPLITVTPSLNVNNEEWHGWLTNGQLVR